MAKAATKAESEILALLAKREKASSAFNKRISVIDAEIELSRKKLKNCSHSATEEFRWEHDDGYGHQGMNTGLHCLICNQVNNYPGSNSWYKGERW